MKKIISFIFITCLVLIPFSVKAAEVTSLNLVDTLSEEEIKFDSASYQESTDKINIYMFRGKGCTYCRKFLNFLVTIEPDYGKYFNLVSYETWNNSANNDLMKQVGTFLDKEVTGVPFIIIGDTTFIGFAESYETSIKDTIVSLYNSENRYDVFTEMKKGTTDTETTSSDKLYNYTITWMFIINVTLFILYIIKSNHDKKQILEAISTKK